MTVVLISDKLLLHTQAQNRPIGYSIFRKGDVVSGSRGWSGRVFAAQSLLSTSMCFLHDKPLAERKCYSRLLLRLGHWCTDQKNAPSLCCTDVHIEQQDFAWFVFSWISERPGLEGDLAEEHSTR